MNSQSPASVIDAVIEAANRGDLDGMVGHFAKDSVLTLNPALPTLRAVYRGRQGIRGFVQRIMTCGFHVEHSDLEAHGDEVSWQSTVSGGLFHDAGIGQAVVASRAIVQDGLIRDIDIHYSEQTVRQLQAGLLEAP